MLVGQKREMEGTKVFLFLFYSLVSFPAAVMAFSGSYVKVDI